MLALQKSAMMDRGLIDHGNGVFRWERPVGFASGTAI